MSSYLNMVWLLVKRVADAGKVFRYSRVKQDSVKCFRWRRCCLTTATSEVLLLMASWSTKIPTWHHLPCMSVWHVTDSAIDLFTVMNSDDVTALVISDNDLHHD